MKGEIRHSYRFKAFRLEVEERQLLHHDQSVPLTPKAFDVLVALVERSGHLVEKEELLHIVWSDSFVEEANIARIIHTLRKTLGEEENDTKFIETVAKKGYRFVAKVSKIDEPDHSVSKTARRYLSTPTVESPQNLFRSNDKPEHQNESSGDRPPQAAERSASRRWILIAVIIFAIASVLGTRFSLFNLFESGGQKFYSIEMSRLSEKSGIYSGDISPDGRFVAFVEQKEGKGALFVKQISTGATITIVPPTLMQFAQPIFSPDSEFIYYVGVTREGVGTLYQVSVLGGENKKILTDVDSNVTFSPDGNRLAFTRHNPNEGGDTIFVMNCDGTNLEPFLETKETGLEIFFGPEWSPDGERLLVGGVKSVPDPERRLKLITVELKDKKISEFANEKPWQSIHSFKWLKNGTGILLVARLTGSENLQIWHLDYPHGTVRQITSDTSNYGSLSISSDGTSIVATRIEMISSLWLLNPQSKVMKQLISENNNLLGSDQLSRLPDGKIIFVRSNGKEADIFSIGESGGGERQLTSKTGINQNPAASPDGQYIVFSSNRNGSFALWRMNPDGGGVTPLTNAENAKDIQPQITPDGQTVIFARQNSSGGSSKLMKISINGGEASVLLPENNTSEINPRLSPDGRRFGFLGYVYENQTANMNSTVKVVGLDGDRPDGTVKESHLNITGDFKWSPDSRSLTYLKKSGTDNLWSISIDDRKETPLTDFNSGSITDFIWSADGKTIIFIKAVYNNNLVLIKDKGKQLDSKPESLPK